MDHQYIICHYGEIALKGGNRRFFEDKLAKNIRFQLEKFAPESFDLVEKIHGRILIKLKKKYSEKKLTEALKNTFGIVNFSFAIEMPSEIGKIEKMSLQILKNKDFKTFRISSQRSDKNFSLNSQEINIRIGTLIVKKLKKKVKLERPDANLFIEITPKKTFLYCEKIEGLGGMPAGTGGKALVLLSGGIDSPVASFFIQKRGVEVACLHFHSLPFTSQASVEKVKNLRNILEKFQPKIKLFLVPFGEIQKEIKIKTSEKLRVVLYRRMMMRIAEKIAEKEGCLALATGDAIGQVASQTLENIRTVSEAIKIPTLRPLIGFDKEEIIRQARSIGTFATSILPHEDCCTRFVPKHPETKSTIEEIKAMEKNLNIRKMLAKSLKEIEIL